MKPAMTPDAIPLLLNRPEIGLRSTPPPTHSLPKEREPTEAKTAEQSAVSPAADDSVYKTTVSKARGAKAETQVGLRELSEPKQRTELTREDARPHPSHPMSEFLYSDQPLPAADSSRTLAETTAARHVIRPSDGVRREHESGEDEERRPGAGIEFPNEESWHEKQRGMVETQVKIKIEPPGGAGEKASDSATMGVPSKPAGKESVIVPRVGKEREQEPQRERAESEKSVKAGKQADSQSAPRQRQRMATEGPSFIEPVREKLNIHQPDSTKRFERNAEPTVNIHIGRIEVRAILPSAPPIRTETGPALSLAEYLRRRREGKG